MLIIESIGIDLLGGLNFGIIKNYQTEIWKNNFFCVFCVVLKCDIVDWTVDDNIYNLLDDRELMWWGAILLCTNKL